MRFLMVLLFFTLTLFSQTTLYPTQCCPAYNNLKHSYNRGDVHLDPAQGYVVRKHHKGQYLISVPHASPQQRWVDETCLAPKSALNVAPVSCEVKPIESNAKDTDKLPHWEENLLVLSWHNAFCETHRRKKECQRSMLSLFRKSSPENRFILHGSGHNLKNVSTVVSTENTSPPTSTDTGTNYPKSILPRRPEKN
jgi:ribonuclease T2